jgi:hypothetical protein
MSAYKQFTTKDIVITPFSANKGFRYLGPAMTASNVGVEVYFGTQPPANKLIYPTSQNFSWAMSLQASSVSGSQNATGFINKLNTNSVYSSVMQLYYSNYFGSMSGSLVATSSLIRGLEGPQNNPFAEYNNLNIGLSGSNDIPIGAIKSPQYDNYLSSTITQTRTALLGEDISWSGQGLHQNYCTVISIPSKLWGNNIEPQSFSLNFITASLGIPDYIEYNIYDDGDGNLLTSGQDNNQTWENQYIGNIAYEHGLAVITPVTSSLIPSSQLIQFNDAGFDIPNLGAWVLYNRNGFATSYEKFNTNLTIGWSSSVTLYEHQYKCVIRENEYGYSLNPSILSGSQSNPAPGVGNTYKDFATGSYFSPYITTVGLYDNDQNLLAIGKLSSPTRVPMNADLEIQVAFDSL